MRTLIKDYRVRKSFTFSIYESKIDSKKMHDLLFTKALYCYVDEDFNLIKYVGDKIEKVPIDLQINDFETTATFKTENATLDSFEKHYVESISGEKLFRNFFFSNDDSFENECIYFLFQPFVIELEKNLGYTYQIYPIVKLVNKESVIIEFDYYPSDKELELEDFSSKLINFKDQIKKLKFPHSYFNALGIEIEEETGQPFSFEGNESRVFSSKEIHVENILQLSVMYLSLLFEYEKYTWFGRTLISLDNINLTDDEIHLIKNGFSYEEMNPLYNIDLINFSEHKDTKFYVFEHTTLTLGNILENYMPATILDEEISILNTKIIAFSKIGKDDTLEDLLDSKKNLQLLKQQISFKYLNILKAHTIMDYSINKLFKINDQIDKIDDLLEISFRQKEFSKMKRDNFIQFIIGLVSIILSTSVIFEYVVEPLYEIRFNRLMPPLDILLNYFVLIILSLLSAFLFIWIINKKNIK